MAFQWLVSHAGPPCQARSQIRDSRYIFCPATGSRGLKRRDGRGFLTIIVAARPAIGKRALVHQLPPIIAQAQLCAVPDLHMWGLAGML